MIKQIVVLLTPLLFLQFSCQNENKIIGKWISENPEKNASGFYIIRQFHIEKDDWEVKATMFVDSLLTSAVFTFRATGKYTIGKQSAVVPDAKEAIFGFEKKYLTLKTQDSALIKKLGLEPCNLEYMNEKDITETGCSFLASKTVCDQEYDLISVRGKRFYLGARPISGGICVEEKRPKSLGFPLKPVTE